MTFFPPPDRGPQWAIDSDGVWTDEKNMEDTISDSFDWTDRLKGLTITNAVCTSDGIGLISSSFTSTTTMQKVNSLGAFHWDITDSGGSTQRFYFKYRRIQRPLLNMGGGATMPGEDFHS